MRVKIVHDDINAGGGSERVSIITMGLLAEMGFKVDLASFKVPDILELKKDFGAAVNSININPVSADLFSVLGLTDAAASSIPEKGGKNENVSLIHAPPDVYASDKEYSLIINTHADLLPYYQQSDAPTKIIIYCHYPLAPQLVQDRSYMRFIRRWAGRQEIPPDMEIQILDSVSKTYDLMMRNSIVLTNSEFSKRAIEKLYGPSIKSIVIYPPVDVEEFRNAALDSKKREDKILVVSRFSPDKQLENTIEIFKILSKNLKMDAKMVLVGNIAADDRQYLEKLRQLIHNYDLGDRVSVEVEASFDRILELMQMSKIYLHPLRGEPFGMSIVEAMSAGLIPVVPDEGGYTEFVPKCYQFSTHQQAAEITAKILIASDNSMQTKRNQLSESVAKFSTEHFRAGLRKVIESALSPATALAA
jgi:alpha-1,2-mannosyltransferase